MPKTLTYLTSNQLRKTKYIIHQTHAITHIFPFQWCSGMVVHTPVCHHSSYLIDLICCASKVGFASAKVTGAKVECDKSPSFCGFQFYCTRFAGWRYRLPWCNLYDHGFVIGCCLKPETHLWYEFWYACSIDRRSMDSETQHAV